MVTRFMLSALLFLVIPSMSQTDSFTVQPRLTGSGSSWQIEFGLNKTTDVAVSIVRVRDSSVIRHLAGGMLGPKAPAPLTADSLHQILTWDGKDDLGNTVAAPESCSVRVRAGMSVQLLAIVGDNPYAYKGINCVGNEIDGMVVDPDGSIYIMGKVGSVSFSGAYQPSIRKYDKTGNYVRTVFPFPSNLSPSQVQGWGVLTLPDGSYIPKNTTFYVPGLTSTILSSNNMPGGVNPFQLFSFGQADRLVVGKPLGLLTLGTDGSMPGTGVAARLVTSPPLPSQYNIFGPFFLTPVPSRGFAYLSGLLSAVSSSGHMGSAPDTGFWKDGQIFKVDLSTGAATSWLALDSVPTVNADRLAKLGGGEYYSAIHGTDVDAQNRVYVCDRLNRRIGIYDSSAVLLGSIPLPNPDAIQVSKTTGNIYAVTRTQDRTGSTNGIVRLFKFAPFDQGAASLCMLQLSATVATGSHHVQMALSEANAKPWLWLGYRSGFTVMAVQDDGTAFSVARNFYDETRATVFTTGYEHLGVDRRNDVLYINDSWDKLFKITDWANPVARPCSTSAHRILQSAEFTIGFNNLLYTRECGAGTCGSCFHGPVKRYTLDALHAPANWPNTGTNIQAFKISNRYGAGIGERGLAVAPDGKLAAMQYGKIGNNVYYVSVFGDSGIRDTNAFRYAVAPVIMQSGGVKYDLQGNLYVGARVRSPSHVIPAAFNGDWGYTRAVGSVMRFNAGDSGSIGAGGPVGASMTYLPPLSPFSNDGGSVCVCRSPRFDVDPYGRLFIPSAVTSQVTVIDNTGNEILQFGKYGNFDSRGGLEGPGTLVPGASIPLASPNCVAASEDYIYVNDMTSGRLLRVRMNYALDNIPGLTEHTVSAEAARALTPLAMASTPNPFKPDCNILFQLPLRSAVRLEVLNASGRLIRVIAAREMSGGFHRLSWNGRDALERPVAAGVYFFRLQAGGKARMSRAVLAR